HASRPPHCPHFAVAVIPASCKSPAKQGPRDALVQPPAATGPTSSVPPGVADVLKGTYRGTVMDGDSLVSVVTSFRTSEEGELAGTYVIDPDGDAYPGTLSDFVEVWPEMFWAR